MYLTCILDVFSTMFEEHVKTVFHGIFYKYGISYMLNVFVEYHSEQIEEHILKLFYICPVGYILNTFFIYSKNVLNVGDNEIVICPQ